MLVKSELYEQKGKNASTEDGDGDGNQGVRSNEEVEEGDKKWNTEVVWVYGEDDFYQIGVGIFVEKTAIGYMEMKTWGVHI